METHLVGTVDRLPFLHCPKPEMGKEENTPLLTLENTSNPKETRKSPVSTSALRRPTDQFIGGMV